MAKAYAFNVPLVAQPVAPRAGDLPAAHSFVSVEPANIVLDTFKPAENGERLVLRFYESYGTKTRAKVKINLHLTSIWETNLMEEDEREIAINQGFIELDFKPYEIKTLALKK